MIKKCGFLILILVVFAIILSGCFEKNNPNVSAQSGDAESGEIQISFDDDTVTYGNGTDIVIYKGNMYYIEYKNNDFMKEALSARYWLDTDSNNQRYVNKIDSRGKITNLFKVTGSTSFYLLDDRFYIKGSNGYLYTVDMKGENNLNLIKGTVLGVDEEGHALYYQKDDDKASIYKLDTKDLSIKPKMVFNNPTFNGNYYLLSIKNGKIYYAKFDDKKGILSLIEHNIEDNKATELVSKDIGLFYKENDNIYDESMIDRVVYQNTIGKYACLGIGYPSGGTMGGYNQGKFYVINLDEKTIEEAKEYAIVPDEGGPTPDNFFYDQVEGILYELNFGSKLTDIRDMLTPLQENDFATRYKLDLDEKLGDEGAQSLSMSSDTKKYDVDIENYEIVGDKVLYTITGSRANPAHEIGWRPAYIRIVSEVYLKDLATGNEQLVYSYKNTDWENQVKESKEELEKLQEGEEKVAIDDVQALSPDEMLLEIKVDNFWEKEFDIRVEEVGGTIFGKRVEYEGHHKKADGTIKIKVAKEVGAMLTVYKNNELEYQFVIDSSM